MKIHTCTTAYPILIDSIQVGTAQIGDIFLTNVIAEDDLHSPAVYHKRCWLLTTNEAESARAKNAHFIELGPFVWFRNCSEN